MVELVLDLLPGNVPHHGQYRAIGTIKASIESHQLGPLKALYRLLGPLNGSAVRTIGKQCGPELITRNGTGSFSFCLDGCDDGFFLSVDFLLREIQRRFDQHAQVHQCIAQIVDKGGERARERARGTACGRLGAGVDQVSDRLGLREVKLVVEKRALGELARARRPQGRQHVASHLQATRHQQLQDHRPAVSLEFKHILPGVGMWPGKPQRQAVIDRLVDGIRERKVGCLARLQGSPQQSLHEQRQPPPRDPHDAHAPASGRGGNGNDGITRGGEHNERA